MVNDVMDVLLIVLNIVLSQIDDSKSVLRLQMGSLDQIEDLHPVTIVQAVLPQILDKLDDQVGLLHLLVNDFADSATLPLHKLVLRKLLVQVFSHLVNRSDNHLSVQI